MKKRYIEFAEIAHQQIQNALKNETILDKASEVLTSTINNDGIIHVFGCGHSQMFGQELCFRTGGLVPINAIMLPHYGIYPYVKYSQVMERAEGISGPMLDAMYTTEHDTMIIVSVSGRNAAVIEMAMAAKNKGMTVIGVSSLDYSNNVTSRHSSGKLMKDYCDIVIDICGLKGDSVLYDERVDEKFCSTSTVVAMTLLVGIVGQTIQNLADIGINPPIFVSGNLDRGDEINQAYLDKYKGKVEIL